LVSDLAGMDAKYRKAYVAGFEGFFDDATDYKKHEGAEAKIDIIAAVNSYRSAFVAEVDKAGISEQLASIKKLQYLATVGVGIVALFAFLGVPLLIEIEQNTRRT
jgi:hypothetical protein